MINEATAGTVTTVNVNMNWYFENTYQLFQFMIEYNILELCNDIICYRLIL